MDCIFCKIIKGEIPCEKIYEDDKILAFLDIKPAVKGHTLLVTKEHYVDFLTLPNNLISHLFHRAKEITPAIMKGANADGFNIGVNNGASAGQVIFHCHLHIIPRFKSDGLTMWQGSEYQEDEIKEYAERIRENLKK